MNFFILDYDIDKCAEYHCDKHCIKIILESLQGICTSHYLLLEDNRKLPSFLYKPTHINHPINRWIRKSLSNYYWACIYCQSLCKEYTYRYERIHKSEKLLEWCRKNPPKYLKDFGLTPFVLAMPDQYKTNDAVESYRNYYLGEKQHLFKWKNREIPLWISLKR